MCGKSHPFSVHCTPHSKCSCVLLHLIARGWKACPGKHKRRVVFGHRPPCSTGQGHEQQDAPEPTRIRAFQHKWDGPFKAKDEDYEQESVETVADSNF